MKIRYKMLVALLGIPAVFALVAIFLVVSNWQVERDVQEFSGFQTKLANDATQLSTALISAQKAAQEIMAEKRRAQRPGKQDIADQGARQAEQLLKQSQTDIAEVMQSLTDVTQLALQKSQTGKDKVAAGGALEQLKDLEAIKAETLTYDRLLDNFLAVVSQSPDEADEVLNSEVEKEYEQKLLPLVQRYAAARTEEIKRKTLAIEQSVSRVSWRVVECEVGAVLLAVVLAIYLTGVFVRPLTKLTIAAAEIGRGRLESRIQVKSRDWCLGSSLQSNGR